MGTAAPGLSGFLKSRCLVWGGGAEVSLRRTGGDGSGTWETDACCRPQAKGGDASQAQPRAAEDTGAQ